MLTPKEILDEIRMRLKVLEIEFDMLSKVEPFDHEIMIQIEAIKQKASIYYEISDWIKQESQWRKNNA